MKKELRSSANNKWQPSRMLLCLILVILAFAGCRKTTPTDPDNRLSYQVGLKKYNYPFLSTPGLFGGTWRSIEAISVMGGFYINANYSSISHNTLHISFGNTVNDLPRSYYAIPDGQVWIKMENYKQKDDGFYIVDPRDKAAYIKFDHVSAEYVEGSFDFTLVKSDPGNITNIQPGKTIRLKNGKFRIKVN